MPGSRRGRGHRDRAGHRPWARRSSSCAGCARPTADRRSTPSTPLPTDIVDLVRDKQAFTGSLYRFLAGQGHPIDHAEAVLNPDGRRPGARPHPRCRRGHAAPGGRPGRLRPAGRPVMYSREWHVPAIIELRVYRRGPGRLRRAAAAPPDRPGRDRADRRDATPPGAPRALGCAATGSRWRSRSRRSSSSAACSSWCPCSSCWGAPWAAGRSRPPTTCSRCSRTRSTGRASSTASSCRAFRAVGTIVGTAVGYAISASAPRAGATHVDRARQPHLGLGWRRARLRVHHRAGGHGRHHHRPAHAGHRPLLGVLAVLHDRAHRGLQLLPDPADGRADAARIRRGQAGMA